MLRRAVKRRGKIFRLLIHAVSAALNAQALHLRVQPQEFLRVLTGDEFVASGVHREYVRSIPHNDVMDVRLEVSARNPKATEPYMSTIN